MNRDPTFVGKACEQPARRQLVRYFLELGSEEGEIEKMTKEIMVDNEMARATANTHLELLCEMGLIEQRGSDRYIRYVPLSNSPAFETLLYLDDVLRQSTVKYISETPGSALTDLYDGESRRILVDSFVKLAVDAESFEPLTKSDIYDHCGVSRKSIINEIGVLVDYDVIEEDNQFSYPRYIPQADSKSLEAIVKANESVYQAYQQNTN